MKQGTGTWYTEKGTTEKPCPFDPSMVGLYRAGKLITYVPKEKA
jgi:hypothetical protein